MESNNYESIELSAKTSSSSISKQTTWESTKSWYSRTVLRSGTQYSQITDQPPSDSKFFHGWRLGALLSGIFVAVCLCLNIAATAYLRTKYPPDEEGLGVILSHGCGRIRSIDSRFHYAINVIATVLVSASNYNMQCLSAPTRTEVDTAHRRRKWLDIGIHSVRNLSHIPRLKAIFWLVLALSSLPLHLLWNSAVFMTTTFNDYSGLVVTPGFLEESTSIGLDCGHDAMDRYKSSDQSSYVACWLRDRALQTPRNLTRMKPKDCMSTYGNGLEGGTFNLLAVTKDGSKHNQSGTFPPPYGATESVLAYFHPLDYPSKVQDWCSHKCESWSKDNNSPVYCEDNNWNQSSTPFSCMEHMVNGTGWKPDPIPQVTYWMCALDTILYDKCSTSEAQKNSSSWKILPEHYEIDYCLTTDADHECQLKYSPMILYIAIACNTVKLASILGCLLMSREPIFATIGDAVDSFLRRPDQASKGRCLMSKLDDSIFPGVNEIGEYIPLTEHPPQPWVEGGIWFGRHGTARRWAGCIFLWLACVIVGIVFMVQGITLVGLKNAFTLGFGALSLNAIAVTSDYEGGSSKSILTTSLIANLPQLLLSGLYFMYNAVLTSMTATHEWSLFAHKRTTLRVTLPAGAQRETYWLGLPWRYSLPFLICSTVFHWLVSQSIFLINIIIYQPNTEILTEPAPHFPGVSDTGMTTACGYSPLAIACALGVALLLFIALILLSSRKLKPGMPVVGSCSLAISAACHPPESDYSVAVKPLLWGAVSHEENGKPGHCCLTSSEVEKPREGALYAGGSTDY
ncbi:unnamed protein product [Penicillium salamii]|uniref:DUF6536 domain-containing protein n=1 Tax=Penicillium salamii TaxID=1612424 RepID=A0A9W4NRP8_9EURO|nr:unnamed protein product [Penicillium salamii]CAG7941779.1 unnamed protein product [Penicillium salamii]CAG7954425.1 unnamed protein product [Penicillium salamii]CAG8120459.1 unnamed protein product [Penicillium salamii]CAG8155400.1 unnamed protein product [Penicillium salamii]